MANSEHVDILKKGVSIWNEWRRQNPKVKPDLSEAHLGLGEGTVFFGNLDLSLAGRNPAGYRDLRGFNLAETDLFKANLYRTDLRDATFRAQPGSGKPHGSEPSRGRFANGGPFGCPDLRSKPSRGVG